MTRAELETHLKAVGSFDPEELTAAVSIQPSKTWRAGERVGRSKISLESDGWRISCRQSSTQNANEQVSELLQILGDSTSDLISFCEDHGLEVILTVRAYVPSGSGAPNLVLKRDIIQALAELRAELDIDVMTLSAR